MGAHENCCKNCANAKGYTGWNDHYCKAFNCGIRAEHYDCPQFIDEDEEDADYLLLTKKVVTE